MTSPNTSAEQKVGGGYKLLGWIGLPLGVVMVLVALFSHRGLYQFYNFRNERMRLEQENARLAAENARLARTIDRLQHDPILIQDLIRQELNFVKKNEIIFQFPPEKPATVSGESTPSAQGPVISAGKVEKPKLASPPSEAPLKKRASHRRE